MKPVKGYILNLTGGAILAFALYNIHSISGITEGGVLGLVLFFENMFGISPTYSAIFINLLFYAFGYKTFGKKFLLYSAVSIASFSCFYKLFEQFNRVYLSIADYPLISAVLGAVFVGIGVGVCVRGGGAPTGDDALAMSLSYRFKIKIQWVYFITDFTVLLLSLFYIPVTKIGYSLVSVIISGQIIGFIQRIKKGT